MSKTNISKSENQNLPQNSEKMEILLKPSFWEMPKKEIAGQAKVILKKSNPEEVYAAAKRLQELANQLLKQAKGEVLQALEGDKEAYGGKFSYRGGGKRYSGEASFGHWQEWKDATARVKELEGLMKAADNPGAVVIYDETGEQVPAARPQTASPQLVFTF